MAKRKVGVLVMSYGTPESLDQIEAYYTHIRRGSPPSSEQLADLIRRYEAVVGGFFPLRENTNNQVKALEMMLNESSATLDESTAVLIESSSSTEPESSEIEFVCYQGLKHASPFIEDGVQQMTDDGIQEAIGIVLAPHYSIMSVGSYIKRAEEKAAELGVNIRFVKSYHLHPKFIEALTQRIVRAIMRFDTKSESATPNQVRVIFTAHSLPEKIVEMKDPYPEQLLETTNTIAANLQLNNFQFAWQSAGRTATPWLGPDILNVLRSIHVEENVNQVLICPIGFVSDHLEVLYDIDIEAQKVAAELGIHLERTESLNTDPLYMQTLCDVIRSRLKGDE